MGTSKEDQKVLSGANTFDVYNQIMLVSLISPSLSSRGNDVVHISIEGEIIDQKLVFILSLSKICPYGNF